ncbi:MAG: DUF6482 family protein [Saccharospirillaceae bacterium]|nr:DUF6482 family protein [Saccharospirillaceae bacterium]MCD8531605.1 DUF6482 family protein [Saccharospirillaceae bacterium]
MTLSELKKALRSGQAEVNILANEGDLYLVQIEHLGQRSLLMEDGMPVRFRGLSECSGKLASLGVREGFMVQQLPYDEMINNAERPQADRLPMHFH